MRAFSRSLAKWREELMALGSILGLFLLATVSLTVATISTRADTITPGSYCYSGYQCSTSGSCVGGSSCTIAGFSCGSYVSGTNLSTCMSYSGYTCVVNTAGPYPCTSKCPCECANGWFGIYCNQQTENCTTQGTNPTKCAG